MGYFTLEFSFSLLTRFQLCFGKCNSHGHIVILFHHIISSFSHLFFILQAQKNLHICPKQAKQKRKIVIKKNPLCVSFDSFWLQGCLWEYLLKYSPLSHGKTWFALRVRRALRSFIFVTKQIFLKRYNKRKIPNANILWLFVCKVERKTYKHCKWPDFANTNFYVHIESWNIPMLFAVVRYENWSVPFVLGRKSKEPKGIKSTHSQNVTNAVRRIN